LVESVETIGESE
jgi:hypothetical protein